MRKSTPVREYMSRLPQEVDRRETLATAMHRMQERAIRHVPVMDGAHVFGILSGRDAQAAWVHHGSAAGNVPVGEVCERRLLSVAPLAPIPEVARQMIDRGVTSALVVDDGVLVGIFTSVDALRVLAAL
jgi:acetoin utilization protein AcuB